MNVRSRGWVFVVVLVLVAGLLVVTEGTSRQPSTPAESGGVSRPDTPPRRPSAEPTNYPESPAAAWIIQQVEDWNRSQFGNPSGNTAESQPLFLASYAAAATGSDDALINDFAYLYDNALAALVLSYAGRIDLATQIADAIVYSSRHDRFYPTPWLRNAYAAGDPWGLLPRDQGGGVAARLPGFWDQSSQTWLEDYYAVSTSTGNLAWAILALATVYRLDGNPDYLNAAVDLGELVLTLAGPDGGFTGGWEGWEPDATKVGYKSTEHNIDLIAAFAQLADLTGRDDFSTACEQATRFVLSLYDRSRHLFATGTTDDGSSVNQAVWPLDTNTWSLLVMGEAFPEREAVLAAIGDNFAVGQGFDFNSDRDGIWWEGTAQMAVVCQALGYEEQADRLLDYLNLAAQPDGSIAAADRDGVTTGLDWAYGHRVHLGATAWLAFAQLSRNPLAVP